MDIQQAATVNNALFSSAHGTYTNIEPSSGIKPDAFKRIVILQNIFSDHNGVKLEIRTIIQKPPSTWKLNSTLINNPWVKGLKGKKIRRHE